MEKKKRTFVSAACIMTILAVIIFQKPLSAGIVELLQNPGFEDILDPVMIQGWNCWTGGSIMSVPDARTGERALKLTLFAGATEARLGGHLKTDIQPGGIYHFSIWARGRGNLALQATEYSAANFIGTNFLRDYPTVSLTDEWQQIRVEYRPEDSRMQRAVFTVVLSGQGAVAYLDDASFIFDPAENPSITLEKPVTEKEITLQVHARDAAVEVFINGVPLELQDNAGAFTLEEGLTSIALLARAEGANPGLRVKINGHPEIEGRWLAGVSASDGWEKAGFDDLSWESVAADEAGYMWHPGWSAIAPSGKIDIYFRQVLLWNAEHYGPDRCILPKVREWGFSLGSMDTLIHAIYSPLPYSLPDYEFILELPEGFELFGKMGDYPLRYVMNNRPERMEEEMVVRDGIRYTRYRMFHHQREVDPQNTQYSLLPVRLDKDFEGDTSTFYFRRQAKGNFTELQQSMPVKILPPINGRQPEKIMISQYYITGYSTMSPEHLEALVEQSAQAGFNFAGLSITEPGWGSKWNDYLRSYYSHIKKNRINTFIFLPGQEPLYGTYSKGHMEDSLVRWVEATPGARARYFKNSLEWNLECNNMYCPDFVNKEGREAFFKLLQENYEEVLAHTPYASVLFLDYEKHPWVGRDGIGSYCFCNRCKDSFRVFAGIPTDVELTDDIIFNEYYSEWSDFHVWQITEIQEDIKNVANRMGLKYMIYSWAGYMPFWSRIKGKADIVFLGSPGNSPADSYTQAGMDKTGRFFREEQNISQVMGQRFSFLGESVDREAWKNLAVLSHDGFVDAKSWKSQILRIIAAHNGVDLQNARECVAGMQYWIGEATRIIAAYEDLFYSGERQDGLASSEQVAYPNLLVLKLGDERLVLIFNESDESVEATINNTGLKPGQKARRFESTSAFAAAEQFTVTVPAKDVVAVHID